VDQMFLTHLSGHIAHLVLSSMSAGNLHTYCQGQLDGLCKPT